MSTEIPDIGAVLGPLLGRVPDEDRMFVLALAERVAARRYRHWAAEVNDPAAREALLACADREEDIASRVEALSPRADEVQASFAAETPELETVYEELFAGYSLPEQLRIQAAAERLGGATWRAFASAADGAVARALSACAPLEEQNAATLDELLARGL